MKKVLILSSSPRRGGNSDTLCNRFMAGAQEKGHNVEKITLADKNVAVPEMAFFHELPEALRELVVAPARARGGNGGICFGHKRILWSKLVRPIWAFSPLVNHSIPTFPKCPDKSVL